MRQLVKTGLLIAAALSIIPACSKKQEPAPNPALSAPQVEAVPAAPPPPPPVQAQAAAPTPGFDGEWKGEIGPDLPISFSIQGNQVTSLSASYSGKNGSCNFSGSISSDGPAAITDKSFTAKGHNDQHGNIEFTATGTLTSSNEAAGTLVWKGKSSLCGDINLQYQWTAKKAPAEKEAAESDDEPL